MSIFQTGKVFIFLLPGRKTQTKIIPVFMERKLYRILDANFNRAREALRTMEEFCRFVLDSQPLAGRAKQMRHRLCAQIAELDAQKLLAERDSAADVGRDLQIADPQHRKTLSDCFTAAAKRASEALRVLSEMAQIENPAVAAAFEQLRFQTYTLEKDIAAMFPRSRFADVRLYVLIPAGPDTADAKVLDLAAACMDGGADALQLRSKEIPDGRLLDLAMRFVDLCRQRGCLSIINDRADIAALTEADGLHLGWEDLPIARARKLFFRPALVGQSTHNEQELHEALAAGADYVGIGPCYPTSTKPHLAPTGLDYIRKALAILKDTNVGHVAIGGITPDNIGPLLEAGVRAVAVSSVVCDSPNPRQTCRQFKEILSKNSP